MYSSTSPGAALKRPHIQGGLSATRREKRSDSAVSNIHLREKSNTAAVQNTVDVCWTLLFVLECPSFEKQTTLCDPGYSVIRSMYVLADDMCSSNGPKILRQSVHIYILIKAQSTTNRRTIAAQGVGQRGGNVATSHS